MVTLIGVSQKHFEDGERELKLGHLDRARIEFDRAVDVLPRVSLWRRTDSRMREHFDRLIDRISAHEVSALAKGDGFAEKKYEPAAIDELLKIATFPKPDADKETKQAVEEDLARNEHDIPIPQNSRVLSSVELLQGRLRDYVQDSLTPWRQVPADDPERLPRGRAAAGSRLHSHHRADSRPTRCRRRRRRAVAVHGADRQR